jgi:hypothetical protein
MGYRGPTPPTTKGMAMAEEPGNQTPNTPEVSETELRGTKLEELRQEAKDAGVKGASDLRKEELVREVARARSGADDGGAADSGGGQAEAGASPAGGGNGEDGEVGAGPDGGRLRTGEETSRSLKYSQEVTSPDEEPERPGRSLATTHHEIIKQWAEARGGTPATVAGTEHGDHLGVLRFDFSGDSENLRRVSWAEWFDTFDARRLNFIYQEETSDGSQSNFFRLESPDREDG